MEKESNEARGPVNETHKTRDALRKMPGPESLRANGNIVPRSNKEVLEWRSL